MTAVQTRTRFLSPFSCRFGGYCDGTSKLCVATKFVGSACSADKECVPVSSALTCIPCTTPTRMPTDCWPFTPCRCASYNCDRSGFCVAPSFAPRTPAVWVYVIVALAIVLLVSGVGIGLFFIHKRSREQNQIKLEQYYTEQVAYRQSLFTLGQTRDSLLNLPKGTSADGARQSLLVAAGREGGTQPRDGGRF